MIPALKAEFRKLLTVRSTYCIVAATLAITAFFAGFIEGFRGSAVALQAPSLLAGESSSAVVFVGLILAFAGLLLVGHEYRYNTIMYTLTSTNRRAKILFAKLVCVSVFAVVATLLVTFFSPLCTIVGAHLHGLHIGVQTFNYWSVIWHCVFAGWAYTLYAFILITIVRNQVGAIVTFLLIPLIGENILAALFKSNSKYLPFRALQSVVEPTISGGGISITHEALVVCGYVLVGLAVGLALFLKRDAN